MDTKKLTIFHVTPVYAPCIGGLEKAVQELAKRTQLDGLATTIITTENKRTKKRFEQINGTDVFRLKDGCVSPHIHIRTILPWLATINHRIYNFIFLIRLIRKRKPHIVHCHNLGSPASYLWILSYLFNFTFIISLQGYNVLDLPLFPAYKRVMFRHILKRAHHITACSAALLKHTCLQVPGIEPRATVIYNGIDPTEFALFNTPEPASPYILCIANLHQYKGIDILIMAFAKIHAHFPSLKLIIIGDGDGHYSAFRELAGMLNISEKVIFLREVHDRNIIRKWLYGCALFVLPSRWEPFGIALLEAMACSKAVIATDAGGPPEFITHGINGLLVKPKDVTALAQAMEQLIVDQNLAQRLGKKAQETTAHFTWDTIYKQYAAVYNTYWNKA